MQYPSDFGPELSKKPICGVLSVAMVAGVTFERATQAIKNNLMPFQKRHGGRTYDPQRVNALRELGVQVHETQVGGRVTLQKFIHSFCSHDSVYSIATSSHCVTVKSQNGVFWVADQVEISPIDRFSGRRCIVRHCVRVK